MKKKIVYLFMFLIISAFSFVNVYAESVDSALEPLKGDIENNVSSLTTVIFIMLGVFGILALIEAIIAGKKSKSTSFLSNKLIRFFEVLILIIIVVLLLYEYVMIDNKVIIAIGIVLTLFAFYQRVSNKNRKWAYTTLAIDVILYICTKYFS